MSKEFNIAKIEEYLNGHLSDSEREAFEKELTVNTELAAQVKMIRDIDSTLEDEKAIEVQQVIQDIGQDFFTTDQTSSTSEVTPIKQLPFYRRPLAIAASILFILTVATVIWLMNSKNASLSNDALFAQYYSIEKINSTLRGDQQADSVYNLAIAQYNQKQYDAAISTLNSLLVKDATNWEVIYTLGNTYLDNNQEGQAKEQFKKIVDNGKSILVPQSIWYLALIDIKEGNREQAEKQLTVLIQTEDQQLAKQAQELLDDLN